MEYKFTKRLSKSKLECYKQCPKKFYFMKTQPYEALEIPALIRGSALHETFDDFEQYRMLNRDKDYNRETCLNLLHKVGAKHKPEYDRSLEMIKTDWEQGPKTKPMKKYPTFEKAIEMFVDWLEEFNFMIPESCEEKIYDSDDDFVAMYDRVDFDGKVRILWDYKTGAIGKKEKFEPQLAWYNIYFTKKHLKNIDYLGIYFADHNKYFLIPVNDEFLQKHYAELHNLKFEIEECESEDRWPTKKNFLCGWCQYRHLCPLFGGEEK